MKHHLIKIQHYGGDADISFHGFVILNDAQLEAFKDILSVKIQEDEIAINNDCDDLLPSIYRKSRRDWRKFEDVFSIEELSDAEATTLKTRLGVSYGDTQAFMFVWDSDEFWKKYSHLHSLTTTN